MKQLAIYNVFAIFIIAAVILSGCSDNKIDPIRLGTNVWLGYEPLYLARSLGYFAADEVKLVEFMSTSEVMRAFTNQSLDAAALTLDEALLLLERGADISIVLVHDISNGADVILGKPKVADMQSLVGKRIGVEGSAVGAYTLSRALELHKLSPKDVTIVQLEINEHTRAYKENHIDAVVTFEPVKTTLLKAGAHEFFSSREIPGEIVDVLVVSNPAYTHHKKHITLLINSWFKALDYLHNFPEDAAQRMIARQKMTAEELLHSFNSLHFPTKEENIRLITGSNPTLLTSAQRLQNVMLANKLLLDRGRVGKLFKESSPSLTR